MKFHPAWIFIAAHLFAVPCVFAQSGRRVNVPASDLRSVPEPASPSLDRDPNQETQLLYGEKVTVLEERGGWARIEADEQEEWSHEKRWQGYPGWTPLAGLTLAADSWTPNLVVNDKTIPVRRVPESNQPAFLKLTLGTHLVALEETPGWWHVLLLDGTEGWVAQSQAEFFKNLNVLPEDQRRQKIVAAAAKMTGSPYYWGGRSNIVDCSGLTHLAYRAAGISIPRDAHEQWMRAHPIPAARLKPADLVFLADPKDPKKITHVMMHIGNDQVIEAPGTGKRVHKTSLQKRLRQALREKRRVYCGNFLS
ncbi:MAG: C40 family peptidase [Candidatus Omnitrophica bacterium]|nr:C40 family peptidase [Candidatus Omnitrophota bacterium]